MTRYQVRVKNSNAAKTDKGVFVGEYTNYLDAEKRLNSLTEKGAFNAFIKKVVKKAVR